MKVFGTVNNSIKQATLLFNAKKNLQNGGIKKSSKPESQDLADTQRMGSIMSKLKSGQRLSPGELKYLAEKAPQLYEKAVKVTKERDEYAKKLKECKTKEEVESLHMEELTSFAAEAKTISNSNIPKAEKLEKLEEINMRSMAAFNEYSNFVASADYQRLPDSEEDKEEKKDKVDPAEEDAAEIARKAEEDYKLKKAEAEKEAAKASSKPDEGADAQSVAPSEGSTGETAPISAEYPAATPDVIINDAPAASEAFQQASAQNVENSAPVEVDVNPAPAPETPANTLMKKAIKAYSAMSKVSDMK